MMAAALELLRNLPTVQEIDEEIKQRRAEINELKKLKSLAKLQEDRELFDRTTKKKGGAVNART